MAEKSKKRKFIWAIAFIISAALLGAVIAHADFGQAINMLREISIPLLIGAFGFLMLEGVATAYRLWIFADKKPCRIDALKANAWYVLLLVMLPARLGEVAAIMVLKKNLGQNYGAATMSIIVQRLYDVMTLGIVFLISLIGLGAFLNTKLMAIIAVTLITLILALMANLEKLLTVTAYLLGTRTHNIFYRLKKIILQARIYSRHNMKQQSTTEIIITTVIKWTGNLGALICLFMALNLDLSLYENTITAAAYNFLAVIPLQTIGGIGVGEAGLALLFAGMGLSETIAANASLMIRLVIIVFPFIFWGLIMGSAELKERLKI